jgi:hypothetical protein
MYSETHSINFNQFVNRLVLALATKGELQSQPSANSVAQNWKSAFAKHSMSFDHATR